MFTSIAKPALAFTLTVASAVAWAAPSSHIETMAFTLDIAWSAESLLSDSGGAARISLANAANILQLDPNRFVVNGDGRGYRELFTVNVRPGYQVTGVSLSGSYDGALLPFTGPQGNPYYINGSASNWGGLSADIGPLPDPSDTYGRVAAGANNVNGNSTVNSSTSLSLEGSFGLFMEGYVEIFVEPGARLPSPDFQGFVNIPSYAGLRLVDPVLTIHTSPVPEPETWAMLLAGIGALGLLRRTGAR